MEPDGNPDKMARINLELANGIIMGFTVYVAI
jgi:hypothetical protein